MATTGGREREYPQLLDGAGFKPGRIVRIELFVSVFEAVKKPL
jgi:hypothetical protein